VHLGPILALRAALAGVAPEVPAPPQPPRLEWLAPPHCPDAARGAEHLARFLGGRTPSAPARVELSSSATGHAATVTVDGATRTLHADDCETLGRAAALVIAVSVDPVAAAAVVLREEDAEVEATPTPEVPEPELVSEAEAELDSPAGSTTRVPDRRTRGTSRRADMPSRAEPSAPIVSGHWLGASGGVGLALVPSLTGAVRLGYAFERAALRVQADLTYATPRTITYPDETTIGGRFQSVALGLRACFAPSARRVSVPLCGGLEGGPILGRGVGFADTRNPAGAWIGGLASAALRVRVHSRVALTVGADLLVSLRRPAFHVGARGTLFRAPPVGLRALAGLELRLR
jgi:hypothetical protein